VAGKPPPSALELFAIRDSNWVSAGRYWAYPEVGAALQVWEHYLQNGGTVQAWLDDPKALPGSVRDQPGGD
jgi:hypothetical protein